MPLLSFLLRGVAAVALLSTASTAFAASVGGKPEPLTEERFIPAVEGDSDQLSADTMKSAGMVLAYDATATGSISTSSRAAPTASVSANDVALVRAAISAFERGDTSGAMAVKSQLADPGAMALVDWLGVRLASRQVGFSRIDAFYRAHRDWPMASWVRRRAEEALWLENVSPSTVRGFFAANGKPERPEGRLALARALLASGDKASAAAVAREAWRRDALDGSLEAQALQTFGSLLSASDHRARAEGRFLADEIDAGMRAANRVGGSYLAIAKARAAVIRKNPSAGALIAAVPSGARSDPGFLFTVAKFNRRADKPREAAAALNAAPRGAALVDADAWSIERRVVARDLLDNGDAKLAYQTLARDDAENDSDKIETDMLAGFIALRALGDAKTAYKHFTAVHKEATIPGTTSRALYWQGRCLEAMGDTASARGAYERAARYVTSYYGQISRARLGLSDLPIRSLPQPSATDRATFGSRLSVRAIDLLYRADQKELALPLAGALAEDLKNPGEVVLLGALTQKYKDPRATLVVGKAALKNGFPMDALAYPTSGIPSFKAVGPAIETPVVHAIARQESAFNPKAVSHANARGLLQLLPGTAAKTAKAAGLPFDAKRLTTDAAFNAQLGAAHLGELAEKYDGSYVMVFAAYNAGPARVLEWTQRYGDPRKAEVDPVDWVERIPFAETRNYVQRVMENTQIYRTRLNGRTALLIERDMARGAHR
ncbi:lytic transglycosylase domain-containing protein [Chenggangzhangella methanolivorans]|uniref:Lytic transglycosylase domain-containing protein n=1 Tax=Chenggangzhangella methanolivorans TaxID=1437009 RepID=A0A9E6RF82_9HYPH|nr:lytic transglycosylase domain-containing protein [Chenggangzhangella methanolivorans]QZO00126.1 lytic transglycosylase domain-containing protein [Chenggangzhangella methanolivorans]